MVWQYFFPAMIFRWCEQLQIGFYGTTRVRYGGRRKRRSFVHEQFPGNSQPLLPAFPSALSVGDSPARLPLDWFLSHSSSNSIPRLDASADRCRRSLLYFLVATDGLFAPVATRRAGNRNDRVTSLYLFRNVVTGLSGAAQKRNSRRPSCGCLCTGRGVDDSFYRF